MRRLATQQSQLLSRQISYSTPLHNRGQSSQEMYFTRTHEWIQLKEKDSMIARVGLSDYKQGLAGDFTYVGIDAIELNLQMNANKDLCDVEPFDSIPDVVKMPVAGTVVKVNSDLATLAALANRSAEHDGWIAEIEVVDQEEIMRLMTRSEYDVYCDEIQNPKPIDTPGLKKKVSKCAEASVRN